MRIASYNVENLFSRAKAMNLDTWDEGEEILAQYSRFNSLIQRDTYSAADKANILDALQKLGLAAKDDNKWVILRQNRGKLLKRGAGGPQVVASGRADWIGWLELKTEAVNETAIRMTAKVIQDLNADVLAVVEAEDRIALRRFDEQILEPMGTAYRRIMLIDGNDERGIDVGVMVRGGCTIESVVSHVDDVVGNSRVFSRDCPEYTINVGGNKRILLLANHFKSKGYGNQQTSNERRKAQAQRVRDIYDQRRAEGIDDIVIAGDFNDTPASDPLSPLLGNGSDLKDIFEHPNFDNDGRPGTFSNSTKSQKIDYLLLSPSLWGKVIEGGVNRMGIWAGANGTLFPHYPEITKEAEAASDHAGIWVDLNI